MNKKEKLICPFTLIREHTFDHCKEKRCAIYVEKKEDCAIKELAKILDAIYSYGLPAGEL